MYKINETNHAIDKNKIENLYKWKKRLFILGFLIGIAILTYFVVFILQTLSTPVAILLWTIIFVFLLRGIVSKLEKFGVNRVLSTVAAYLIMFLVIGLILFFMFTPVFGFVDQINNIINNIPKYTDIVKDWINDIYGQYGQYLNDVNVKQWINDASSNIGNIGGTIASIGANSIFAAGTFIGNMFMAIGIALVIAFWILIELPAIGKEASKFVKPKYKTDILMWKMSFTQVMAGFIKGTFLQCAIIGFISGIFCWITGIGSPGALGCIIAVFNIIPIFGPILGAIVAFIGGIFNNIWMGIIALLFVSCLQGFVYTFISPKIMSSSCNIHPVLILLVLTAGGAIGGVISGPVGSLVGMLLAIPFVAVFKSLFIYYFEKRTGICLISEDGFLFKGTPYEKDKANPFNDALAIEPKKEK